MVDEESQGIRDEVMRALAEQEGGAETTSVSLPAWDRVAEVAAEVRDADAAGDAGRSGEEVARLFLAAVFDDVRARSAEGKLAEPAQWLEAGLVPEGFSTDDWEMFVYEYLEERREGRAEEVAAVPVRTATRAVGVPRMLRTQETEDPAPCHLERSVEETVLCHPERRRVAPESKDPERCDGAGLASDAAPDAPPCDDIVALVGAHSYHLYSTERMTDAYARWAFLAAEDDRMLTFVECVRDESRKYPRPMEASSLANEPFNLATDEIDELWRTVRDSGAYPDLGTTTASNGDVYYFSTEYLSPAYAASLAEWNSVERSQYL